MFTSNSEIEKNCKQLYTLTIVFIPILKFGVIKVGQVNKRGNTI